MTRHSIQYQGLEAIGRALGRFRSALKSGEIMYDDPILGNFLRDSAEKWFIKLFNRCNRQKFQPARKCTTITLNQSEMMVLQEIVRQRVCDGLLETNITGTLYMDAIQQIS